MGREHYEIATRKQLPLFSRETIKPSSPTPSHLKRYNLSSMDQVMSRSYIPIVLFFPNNNFDNRVKTTEISLQLKQSLSKTLAKYYPFAGRLTPEAYVDCNDEGIEFEEAQIKSRLSEILEKQKDVDPSLVFPLGLAESGFCHDSSLMVIRLTHFGCGGVAIAVCLSHKVADASTFFAFLKYWAAVTHQSSSEQLSPHFVSHPPSNDPIIMQETVPYRKNLVTKTFVFHNSKIAHLKTIASSTLVQNPSRFEVLTALLYKCAITAAESSSGFFSPSLLLGGINMRPKMIPALPRTSVGNFLWQLCVPATTKNELNMNSLTHEINKAKMQVVGMKVLDLEEAMSTMKIFTDYKVYFCSSLCNFGMYEVDFGWGKPMRVNQALPQSNSSIIFMDTPNGDGIEAQVTLDEQDMVKFELDEELLSFASLD